MKEELRYGHSLKGMRTSLKETLLEICGKYDKAMVIDCETGTASNIIGVKAAFPEKYVPLGVSEQNALSFAFGLHDAGFIPIVPLLGAFISRRAYDQIFLLAAYPNINIKMIQFL